MKHIRLGRHAAVAIACLVGVVGSCVDLSGLNRQDGTVEPFEHLLDMKRHVDQPISTATVDGLLAEAGGLLTSVETECPDVYCPVTFTRSGSIGVFSEGDAILTSEEQLDEVFDVDGDFKIVTFMAGVCGAPADDDPAVVLGCAATGASVVIVFDAPTDVWAHEWGHVQGLPHRNSCDRNVMHAYALQTNAVNATERNAFLTPTPGGAFLSLRRSDEELCSDCGVDDASLPLGERVRRLIEPRYLQGIPRDALGDVPVGERVDALLAAWAGAGSATARANVARLLGYAGDERGSAVLAAWVNGRSGEMSMDELAALTESLLASGRLAAVDADGSGLAVLIAGTQSAGWAQRGLRLRDAGGVLQPADAALRRISVLALGLSGLAAAREHLRALQAEQASARVSDRWFAVQVDEALARMDGGLERLRPIHRPSRQP